MFSSNLRRLQLLLADLGFLERCSNIFSDLSHLSLSTYRFWMPAELISVESSEGPAASAEMAPSATSQPPSSPSFSRLPRMFLLSFFFILLSCPQSVNAGSSEKNCTASGDPCQEGGLAISVRELPFNTTGGGGINTIK